MTLLVVLLSLIAIGLLAVVILLATRGARQSSARDASALQDRLSALEVALKGLEGKLTESTGNVRESLSKDIQGAREVLAGLKATQEERQRIEEEMRQATRRIENVLSGTGSRGQAGENILAEAFRYFPPGLIEPGFRVKGKVVEYALVLPSGRRLPIDSRWPDPELLASLAVASPDEQAALTKRLEDAIEKKAQEVAKYLDAASTATFAIAAIPDAAFAVCCKAHHEAYFHNVILMPYSMTVPYLLALYRLHAQYAGSVDMQKLAAYLGQLEDGLRKLDERLEATQRGATMVTNAYRDAKGIVGDLRQALPHLQASSQPQIGPVANGQQPAKDIPVTT